MAPVLTYLAVEMKLGFAVPMMISTMLFLFLVVIAVLLGPETKGKRFSADLEVIKAAQQQAACTNRAGSSDCRASIGANECGTRAATVEDSARRGRSIIRRGRSGTYPTGM